MGAIPCALLQILLLWWNIRPASRRAFFIPTMTDDATTGTPGRPTKYDPAYCKQVRKLCLLGLIDRELAEFFEVSESTLNVWKIDHPEFARAIKAGKLMPDAEVARAAYISCVRDRNPQSIKFWLTNRRRVSWRDRQEHHVTGMTEDIARAIDLGIFNDDELEQISAGKLTKELLDRVAAATRDTATPGEG